MFVHIQFLPAMSNVRNFHPHFEDFQLVFLVILRVQLIHLDQTVETGQLIEMSAHVSREDQLNRQFSEI